MAYTLLWVEGLVASLLLVAIVTARTARWDGGGSRAFTLVAFFLFALGFHAGLVVVGLNLYVVGEVYSTLLVGVSALAGAFVVGSVLVLIYGFGRRDDEARAADWSGGWLALAFVVAAGAFVATFWSVDLSIRDQAGEMRARAEALARSVAPSEVPDADNAAIEYGMALAIAGAMDDWSDDLRDRWQEWSDTDVELDGNDSELRAVLREKSEAFRLLRLAAKKSACRFERDYSKLGFDAMCPDCRQFQDFADLLSISARLRAADGDANAAAEDVKAMLALSNHVASYPMLVPSLVAMGIEGKAIETAQTMVRSGTFAPADLARVRLGGEPSWRPQFHRAIVSEEAFMLWCLAGVAEGRIDSSEGVGHAVNERIAAVISPFRVFVMPPDIEFHAFIWPEMRRLSMQPYWQAKEGFGNVHSQLRSRGGILSHILMPALAKAAEMFARQDAKRSALAVAVAACRYRTERGDWPLRIEDLVPRYIPVVPVDPFDGKPMRWKADAERIVIYSVGPDEADDEGQPFESETQAGDFGFELPRR